MKDTSLHLTKLVRVRAIQNGTPVLRVASWNTARGPICHLVSPWFSAGHDASSSVALPTWYPGLSDIDCCFYRMVTFIHYKHLCHNSDLLNGSWKKLFWVRTSYPQHCLSMPLPRVAWTVFVPEPSSSSSVRLGVNSRSPTCTNKQGHLSADEGSPYAPVFICGPSSVIPSSFRCCNCLKKIAVPKGNEWNKINEKNHELLKCIHVGVWMCVYKDLY